MEFNIVSLVAFCTRVLSLSANVKFVFNIVRIFNSECFFDIHMRRNSGSSVLSAFDCEEALYIVTS